MEIYKKDKDGKLQETNILILLTNALNKAGFKLENGSFEYEHCSWVGVVKDSKNSTQVTVNICFEDCGNVITHLNVYEAPIKKIVDEDNMRQII